MAKDTVTIALDGEITIQRFATAMNSLVALIQALSRELVNDDSIKWIVQSLEVSSAIATARGESNIMDQVEQVVNAYEDVGVALESGVKAHHSDRVQKIADDITRLLDDGITSIRFETRDRDSIITKFTTTTTDEHLLKSFGAVEGRIQTLTNRKGVRFILYDTLRDKAISCYLPEGQENMIRAMWGKRAIIQGEIARDKKSGRPVAIRNISKIFEPIEVQAGAYLKARGIVPIAKDEAMLPETKIRQARNAV